MEPFIICEPYLDEIELQDEDEFMILACDGVWVSLAKCPSH